MLGLELKRNARIGGEGEASSRSQYRIRKVLSVSELAVVYAARNETDGSRCVVKEFCRAGSCTEARTERRCAAGRHGGR
ncbi:hypothetical protein HMSSN036_39890 [Paenibacillus macerans]|nr:hypothetical protein HMSSN036_39890 [Paenibacillus macerans]